MIDLTDREKKIILIEYIVHGVSPYSEIPLPQRIQMLQSACSISGLGYNDTELLELGETCLGFQEEVNNHLEKWVADNNDVLLKAHIELAKGNDSLESILDELLGKKTVNKGLDLLRKYKLK